MKLAATARAPLLPKPLETDGAAARQIGSPSSSPMTRRATWWDDWWFAVSTIVLIVASDFKWRTRDPSSAVSASIDLAIIIELVAYASVGAFVVLRHGRPPAIRGVPLQLVLCTFLVGLIGLSVAYATYFDYGVARAGQMMVLLMLVLVASADASRAHFHRFFHAYMGLIVVSVAYGIAVPTSPVNTHQAGRFTWLAIHPTVAGVYTGAAAVLALVYAIWAPRPRPGPRWPRGAYVAVAAIAGTAMVAVHTRGAVLGAAVGVFVAVLALFRGPARARAIAAMLGIATVAALAASDVVTAYFVRGDDTERLTTLSSRTELWAVARDALERQPMFGYGVGSARGIFYTDLGLGGGHNAAVNVAVELGLVGFACWCVLVLTVLARATKLGGPRLPTDIASDRAVILVVMSFLLVDGFFYEGLGAASNGAITVLFVSAAWLATIRQQAPRRLEPSLERWGVVSR